MLEFTKLANGDWQGITDSGTKYNSPFQDWCYMETMMIDAEEKGLTNTYSLFWKAIREFDRDGFDDIVNDQCTLEDVVGVGLVIVVVEGYAVALVILGVTEALCAIGHVVTGQQHDVVERVEILTLHILSL